MKCNCGSEMIHGGDHDAEDLGHDGSEWLIVSNYSCPECEAFVLFYTPNQGDENG